MRALTPEEMEQVAGGAPGHSGPIFGLLPYIEPLLLGLLGRLSSGLAGFLPPLPPIPPFPPG